MKKKKKKKKKNAPYRSQIPCSAPVGLADYSNVDVLVRLAGMLFHAPGRRDKSHQLDKTRGPTPHPTFSTLNRRIPFTAS